MQLTVHGKEKNDGKSYKKSKKCKTDKKNLKKNLKRKK